MQVPSVYAGFWKRAAAAIIDGIILAIAGTLVGMLFATPDPTTGPQALPTLVSIAIGWIYGAYQESSEAQATIGKRVMGIKVTGTAGNRITFLRATGRHFAKYVSAAVLLIGYLMPLFTAKKQALHDMIAETIVVNG